MRILLDEQLPRRLARQLSRHQVRTVQQQGWAGMRNGELLRRAAAAGFEILPHGRQEFPIPAKFSWVIDLCDCIKIEDLLPVVAPMLDAIRNARPGEVLRVSKP